MQFSVSKSALVQGLALMKLNPNTQRPRRIELVVAGKVRDSGETASGRKATIWEAVG
jgi:hypothetical protein